MSSRFGRLPGVTGEPDHAARRARSTIRGWWRGTSRAAYRISLRRTKLGAADAAAFRAKQERADDQSPGRPTGIALAALSLALAQLTAPDLWFSPGPQASGKERVL